MSAVNSGARAKHVPRVFQLFAEKRQKDRSAHQCRAHVPTVGRNQLNFGICRWFVPHGAKQAEVAQTFFSCPIAVLIGPGRSMSELETTQCTCATSCLRVARRAAYERKKAHCGRSFFFFVLYSTTNHQNASWRSGSARSTLGSRSGHVETRRRGCWYHNW
jgi:hypothetical protein